MLVCICKGISDKKIRTLVRDGQARSIRDVMNHCKAGSDCGSCVFQIREILDDEKVSHETSSHHMGSSGEG